MYLSNSLNFADSAWHVFTAALIFFLGACVALLQYRMFRVPQRLAIGLYFWHTIFCLYYLIHSQSNPTDASWYFINSQDISGIHALGSSAVTFLTALFTQGLNLSYSGVFMVFNIVGFIGMLALASVVLELTRDSSRQVRLLALIILLLPGLSFWSAAIGKDALTFFASCLAAWASMDLIRRYPGMILAVLVMLVARPHMAAILLIALSATTLISERRSVMTWVFFFLVMLPTAFYLGIFALNYVGLRDGVNIEIIANFIEERQGLNAEGGLSFDIASMSLLVRMFTYLYRPLFFDGGGLLGLIVSIESLILLTLSMAAAYLWFIRRKSALPACTWWFFVIFVLMSWFILSNTTANLGIAMRQKWMFMPMILILCFSYIGRPLAKNQRTRN
ncbi:hypothetical protein HKCCA1065_01460 [Rhodobacterales bacterium HKCCA1065]|nr:hypothetical protein [Rhodobacterales bacterium HKCCA1065]